MAKKSDGKTLVRAADGKLYLLSKTGSLEPVADDHAKEIEDALPKIQEKLEALVAQEMSNVAAGCNQNVRIEIPDAPV
jgi:hypothetical protein